MGVGEAWSKHLGLRAALTGALAFVYVWLGGPVPLLQADSIHDYSLVRLCAEGQGCFAHGTSIEGLDQGRLLLVLLAGLIRLGLSPPLHHLIFIGLTAVGVALLAELGRALAGNRAGLTVAALAAWTLPAVADHPLLWNPTLASLPLALMTVSCAGLALRSRVVGDDAASIDRRRRSSWAGRGWALGFALGLVVAYHGHIVHLVAWPVASVLVGAVSEDRGARAIVVLGPALGLVAFDHAVFLANLRVVLGSGIGWLMPLSIVAGVFVGAGLRSRWLAQPDDRRGVLALALAWQGGAIVAVVGLGSLVADLPFEGRYLAAACPALVVLGPTLAERVDARVGLAASVLVAIFVAKQLGDRLTEDRSWTYADVVTIDAALREEAGVSLTELGPWIRAPDGQDLVNAARTFMAEAPARRGDGSTIQILPLAGSACAAVERFEGWRCVALDRRLSAAWSRDAAPWIDPARFETCAELEAGAGQGACVTVVVEDPAYAHTMGAPRYVEAEALTGGGAPDRWIQRLRVRAPAGGRRQLLLALGWRLREAEGVEAEAGAAHGSRQTIWLRAEPGAEGILIVEAEGEGGNIAPATPAVASELGPEDAAILELVLR